MGDRMKSDKKWEIGVSKNNNDHFGVRTVPLSDDPLDFKWIITPTPLLDGEDVSRICSSHNARLEHGEGLEQLYVESLTNQDLLPIIRVTLGSETASLNYKQMRDHIVICHEVIEGAISDATMARFAKELLVSSDEAEKETSQLVAEMLDRFRRIRNEIGQIIHLEEEVTEARSKRQKIEQEINHLETNLNY